MASMKEVLTTFEAARICHVSYNTIKNWIKRGLLDSYRTAGGHMRIKSAALEVFCREHSIPMDASAGPQLRKVLIVDDEESIRTALKEIISQYPDEKFEIYTAEDGFEAGSLMETVRPDLVVLDLIMSGMDGFKVCHAIRKSPVLKHAKIVVLTGYPSESNIDRATDMGADLCLAKPIDRAALYGSMGSMLEPRRGVRGHRRKLKDKS